MSSESDIDNKSPRQRANLTFYAELKLILNYYANLTRLSEYFHRNVRTSNYLHFEHKFLMPDGSEQNFEFDITKKDIRGLYLKLRDRIKKLGVLYRQKRTRKVVDLDALLDQNASELARTLKGQNSPVYATEPLIWYMQNENFGTVEPPTYNSEGRIVKMGTGEKLIQRMGELYNGFGLKAAFALMFFHAIRVADTDPDNIGGHKEPGNHRHNYYTEAMLRAFGGSDPTPYYYDRWAANGEDIDRGLEGLRSINQGEVKANTIDYLINTKYAGKDQEGKITRDYVLLTVIQTILNLNIHTKEHIDDNMKEVKAKLENDDDIRAYIGEYLHAKDVRKKWELAAKPKTDLRRKNKRTAKE